MCWVFQILDVSNNKLRELPAALNELTVLRKLNVKNNKLDNLPTHLAFLTSLKDLNIEGLYLCQLLSLLLNLIVRRQSIEEVTS